MRAQSLFHWQTTASSAMESRAVLPKSDRQISLGVVSRPATTSELSFVDSVKIFLIIRSNQCFSSCCSYLRRFSSLCQACICNEIRCQSASFAVTHNPRAVATIFRYPVNLTLGISRFPPNIPSRLGSAFGQYRPIISNNLHRRRRTNIRLTRN